MYDLENIDNFFWTISDTNASNFFLRGDDKFDGTKNQRLLIKFIEDSQRFDEHLELLLFCYNHSQTFGTDLQNWEKCDFLWKSQ